MLRKNCTFMKKQLLVACTRCSVRPLSASSAESKKPIPKAQKLSASTARKPTVLRPDYEGSLFDGKWHGSGKLYFPDGSSFEGSFVHGVAGGHGTFSSRLGVVQEIQLTDDILAKLMLGKYNPSEKIAPSEVPDATREPQAGMSEAVPNMKNDEVNTGKTEENVPHGQDKLIYKDGSTLPGEFKEGKVHSGAGSAHFSGNGVTSGTGVTERKRDTFSATSDGKTLQPVYRDGKIYSGHGVFTYPNGDTYEGEFRQYKKHGQGKLTHRDGSTLEGEFRDGRIRNGSGSVRLSDGGIMTATWVDGRKQGTVSTRYADGRTVAAEYKNGKIYTGSGAVTFPNGDTYEGELYQFRKHGLGTVVYKDKGTYTGGWAHNLRHGQGTYIYPNGDKYEGEWREGDRHGQGKNTYANGAVLQGEFRNGWIYNGSGLYICDKVAVAAHSAVRSSEVTASTEGAAASDNRATPAVSVSALKMKAGDSYAGGWLEGQFHGPGVYTNADGRTLQGEFRAGKLISGQGTLVGAAGNVFEGEWRDGKVYTGTVSYAHLDKEGKVHNYVDQFVEGVQHSNRMITFPNGAVYEGGTVQGRMHGLGRLARADGVVYEGEWRDGKCHGRGTMRYPTGDTYEGEWAKGNRHGQGKLTNKDGSTLEGEFREGKIHNGSGVLITDKQLLEGTWVDGVMSGAGRIRKLG